MAKELDVLEQAQATIEEQAEQLKELTAPAWRLATVSAVYDKTMVVSTTDGGNVEIERINGADKKMVGKTVRLNMAGQIVSESPYEMFGQAGTVDRIAGELIQVSCEAGLVTVKTTKVPVQVGDEVVLNQAGNVIVAKIEAPPKYLFKEQSLVNWDSIGGLTQAKAALREAFELPYTQPALYSKFKKSPPKGFLLHGRPGNGKTMLGKAVATAISVIHKGKKPAFLYVKGPELLSKWVGESEERIRGLFHNARKHKKEAGFPAVIFIDEADALLTVRGHEGTSFMSHTIVPMFLSEMDGLDESGAIVILATNRADTLDPAVMRAGRIDRKVFVGAPSKKDALEILRIHTCKLPVEGDREAVLKGAIDALYSDDYPIYRITPKYGYGETLNDVYMHLVHLTSGAFVAGIAEQATQIAIQKNVGKDKVKGLELEDFTAALKAVQLEQKGLNHNDEIAEFVSDRGLEPESVEFATEIRPVVEEPEDKHPWSWRGSHGSGSKKASGKTGFGGGRYRGND